MSEASSIGVTGLIKQAEVEGEKVILRNNKPVAAVVSIQRLEELEALEDAQDDVLDIALASARLMTAGEKRYTLDDVLAQFGYTREQLTQD